MRAATNSNTEQCEAIAQNPQLSRNSRESVIEKKKEKNARNQSIRQEIKGLRA
jgi:hypothetical protein